MPSSALPDAVFRARGWPVGEALVTNDLKDTYLRVPPATRMVVPVV